MDILVVSIHNLQDGRIRRHLTTIVQNNNVVYANASLGSSSEFSEIKGVVLNHLEGTFVKAHPFTAFRIYRFFWSCIRRSTADILHIHDPHLLPLAKIAVRRGMKVVYDKHERYEVIYDALNARIGTIFERFFHKYIAGCVYVNEMQLAYLTQLEYPVIRMIPNFQSITEYMRVDSSVEPKKIVVIYIGSLDETSRNICLMLDVLDSVLSARDNVFFYLGGCTRQLEVTQRIEKMKIHPGFCYLGHVSHERVVSLTTHADIGLYFQKLNPNNEKSSPNKIYEYLLSGTAIVAMGTFTDAGIIDKECGIVFSYTAKREDIVEALTELIDNVARLELLKEKSRNMGKGKTWESVSGRYQEIYSTITSAC